MAAGRRVRADLELFRDIVGPPPIVIRRLCRRGRCEGGGRAAVAAGLWIFEFMGRHQGVDQRSYAEGLSSVQGIPARLTVGLSFAAIC